MRNPELPYNDLPFLCGRPVSEFETIDVLRHCIEARAALARLDASSALLPNREILARTIPLMEAQASSEIENVVTTNDELFRRDSIADAVMERLPPAQKEAFGYREGILAGSRMIRTRPLCTNLALDICRQVKADPNLDIRKIPGCVLRESGTGRVVYTPPVGEDRIRGLMADWEKFINDSSNGIDPLIRMAVGHYQFESIHPFPDGNGRTGRLLCILFLIREGLLQQPTLYLSSAIVRDKAAYYRAIEGVRDTGKFEPVVLYFMDAIRETANWTAERIQKVVRLMAETKGTLREMGGGIYSHELINVLFRLPYCRIRNLVDAGIAKPQTAGRYLHALANAGILREIPSGREKLFLNWRLYDILCGGAGQ